MSTPLALLLALRTDFSSASLAILLLSILLRWRVAWQVATQTDDLESWRWLHWLPLRDMMTAPDWALAQQAMRPSGAGSGASLLPGGRMRAIGWPTHRPTHHRPS